MIKSTTTLYNSLLFALVFSACATETAIPPAIRSQVPVASAAGNAPPLHASPLDQLWKNRVSKAADFPIGVGDIIEVSFPGLQDLDTQSLQSAASDRSGESLSTTTVRVDGKGDIILPLLGRMHVAGLTEDQLRDALIHGLDHYMYDPEVKIFVKSYSSREVAVSGEVHSPGMYTIHGPNETIHDLIIRAGGTTTSAAPKVILTPGKVPGTSSSSQPDYSPMSAADLDRGSLEDGDAMLGNSTPYVVDLSSGKYAEHYLALPVRPGDMIYVPRAGSVTVTGWVHSPRSIDITQGLTVLGAVAATGGPLFAADQSRVRVFRQDKGLETKTIMVNLKKVEAARAPDMLVQANDVIDVPYSAVRIPGYAVYYGVQGLVSFAPAMLLVGGVP